MKISTDELNGLIRLIESQPYRPLKAFEAKMLKRFKKKREKRDGMKKDHYTVAKAIRGALNVSAVAEGGFTQAIIRVVARRIGDELASHNSKFNKGLFLHTCGVEE